MGRGLARWAVEHPAQLVAFDVLADGTDLRALPLADRARHIAAVVARVGPAVTLCPQTLDLAEVEVWMVGKKAREQDLLHRARAEDVLHWQQHQRPISAETLRKRLHVGADTARGLVTQLRSDTHIALDGRGELPAGSTRSARSPLP